LHQLQIFLKVVEKQSITKAAEDLHLTQPAVSIQLKKLQEQFDIPLIEVIGRQVFITDFGREMAKASQRIMDEVRDISHKTLAYKGYLAGQLKISIVSTAKYVMPYFLSEFIKTHPGVDLTMDVTNKGKVLESLEQNEVDFSLVSVLPAHIQVKRVELMQNKLYLTRKYDPKQKTQSMQVRSLEKVSLIYREKGSATRQAMERFIRTHQLPMKKSIALTSNEAVKQAVIAGLGYSVMPLIGLKNELLYKDLEIVNIKGLPIITHWNLIWLKDKKLSPIALAYLDFLEKNKALLIKKHFSWSEKY
jgi:DNA-binding transcriptional LysR family regulator